MAGAVREDTILVLADPMGRLFLDMIAAERGAALAAADAFAAAHALPEALAEALAEAHRPPALAVPTAAVREGRSPAKRARHHGGGPQPPA